MRNATRRLLREYGATIFIAVGFALLIRSFFIEAYRIPSSAMKPTLLPGDTLFVSKWPIWLKKNYLPNRGDVVVFSGPDAASGLDYIRRVVGLPGDRVAIKQGSVVLNGKPLAIEDGLVERLPEGKQYPISKETPLIDDTALETVPEGSLFVIGDSRTAESKKKRKFKGLIPLSSLKGKVIWLWLSVEPQTSSSRWLPQFRLDRMFQRIN